jgi:D-aminoacyl-tRNA deacylase
LILIVASKKDVASLNIRKQILDNYSHRETGESFQENPVYTFKINQKDVRLVTLNDESIYAQNLADPFNNLELAVFISRHSSLSGTPTLSVHTPGNLGNAELGGISRKVSISPANTMRDILKAMAKFKQATNIEYQVSYECTHHGPSLNVPAMFAELGSSPAQWSDSNAAEVVARAVVEGLATFKLSNAKPVLGIGGPHYNGKFTKMALETEVAFGHMIPKYAVADADLAMLKHCVEQTMEKVEAVILDWKGIRGENKAPLVQMLREMDVGFEKV